jgi:hypothetical protein
VSRYSVEVLDSVRPLVVAVYFFPGFGLLLGSLQAESVVDNE